MTRYILAFGMLGIACLAYIILAFGARFDRTDELTGDTDTERSVRERIKRERAGHHGRVTTHIGERDHA